MSVTEGYIKFGEFFKSVYDAAITEPYASRFKEASTNADREGMIKILIDIPCVKSLKIIESYKAQTTRHSNEIAYIVMSPSR